MPKWHCRWLWRTHRGESGRRPLSRTCRRHPLQIAPVRPLPAGAAGKAGRQQRFRGGGRTQAAGTCRQQRFTPECQLYELSTPQAGLAQGPCSFRLGLRSTPGRARLGLQAAPDRHATACFAGAAAAGLQPITPCRPPTRLESCLFSVHAGSTSCKLRPAGRSPLVLHNKPGGRNS